MVHTKMNSSRLDVGNARKTCLFSNKQQYSIALLLGPDSRQDYPLNLSISLSGGKETNKDSPSNGE